MKKSTLGIVIVLAIILVFAFIYSYSTRQANGPQPEPIGQNGEVDTSDWQTYRNEELGFEFKYPREWFLRSSNQLVSITSYDPYDETLPLHASPESKLFKLEIKKIHNSENLTLENWIDNNLAHEGIATVLSREYIEIDGEEAIKSIHQYGSFTTTPIYIKKDNFIYILNGNTNRAIDSIINGFRFI